MVKTKGRTLRFLRLLLLAGLTSVATGCAAPARACSSLAALAGGSGDASQALADCLRRTPPGGRLELPSGTYRLHRPLTIARPVTIATAGSSPGSPRCDQAGARCATLLIDPRGAPYRSRMPVEILGDNVAIDRLVIRGVEPSGRLRGACGRPEQRPMGGGMRVGAVARFALTRSVLRDFTCYTALEVVAGARDLRVANNLFGPNGDHRPGEMWSDGLTIHDAARAVVVDNLFFDNTDVQLVLGGCRDCRIERNRFSHGGSFRRAAFAELMLHAWPNTSGNFQGSMVTGNRIDCGPQRRCGFGMMIGSAPWYPGRTQGGTVTGNSVSNAQVGINIDALSGPMEVRGNRVRASGGRHRSDCGLRDWPAVNVGPGSRRLVKGDPSDQAEGFVDSRGCLLARDGS